MMTTTTTNTINTIHTNTINTHTNDARLEEGAAVERAQRSAIKRLRAAIEEEVEARRTRRALAGADPETELTRQTGPEPEPDVASPSRTEREPTRPMLDGPGSEPGP